MYFRARRVSLLCPPSTSSLPLSLIKQSFHKHGALLSTRAGNEVWFLPQRDLKPSEGKRARRNPAPHCAHRYRTPCGDTQDGRVWLVPGKSQEDHGASSTGRKGLPNLPLLINVHRSGVNVFLAFIPETSGAARRS